jgi:hypothetical protein
MCEAVRSKKNRDCSLRFPPRDFFPEGCAMTFPTPEVPPGRYRHFKGGQYEVLGVARHSETEEEFVVYRPLSGDGGLWVRPKRMFVETVTAAGESVPRFRYLGPAEEGAHRA